ncbi:hypothetical protein NMG60_11032688 [Bertholletia excelsa]
MPPRVLKRHRPSSDADAEKSFRRKPLVSEEDSSLEHDYHHRRPPQKDEKGRKVDVPRMVEEASTLELEDNEFFINVKANGSENKEIGEHRTVKDREKEASKQGVTNGKGMLMGNDKSGEAVSVKDVGDKLGDGLNGFEEEHDKVVKQRRKKKEFEVFVGGLDYDTTEEDLRKVFSHVGEITELRLSKNPLTNKNKGFAFVHFATVEQARRAVNELKSPVINGKQCGVARSQDKDTLFLGNICKEWKKETLKEKLVHCGVDKFVELTLVEDLKNEGKNRGFAFLDFFSREDALEAYKRFQNMDVVFGTDRPAKVAFAVPVSEPDEEIMLQVRQVFIDGLPSIWDERDVREHLKKFGRIEKVELARNMPAAKRTDFGFITFDSHDAAVDCVNGIDNSELGHGDKKGKVRARLTKPRHRGKHGKYARGYPIEHGSHQEHMDSRGSQMLSVNPRKLAGHNGRNTNHSSYDRVHKQSRTRRGRDMDVDVFPDMVKRRRQFASLDRSFGQRSPGFDTSLYGDYIDEDEYFSGPSDLVRASWKRQSGKAAYTSRGFGYSERSRKNAFCGVAHAMILYGDDDDNDDDDDDDDHGYERYMERFSNYNGSQIGEPSSHSGSKQYYSAYEESHSRHGVSTSQSGDRYDGGGISFRIPYGSSSHRSDSKRMRQGAPSMHDGERWISTRHSRGQHAVATSSRGYRKEGISRRHGEILSYSYDRDFSSRNLMPSLSDLDSGSYSPLRSSDRMTDGYISGKRSGSYY